MLTRRDLLFALGAAAAFHNSALTMLEKHVSKVVSDPNATAEDEDFWRGVRQAFSLDPNIVNFNNGGCSPSPRVVQECLRRQLEFANQAVPGGRLAPYLAKRGIRMDRFANPDRTFAPGMFGRVQMAAAAPAETLLVPEAAIGAEQARKFVMVVDADNVARPKYVTLGPVVEGLRVVAGIASDDNVIVNGLIRARPGAKVAPHQQSPQNTAAVPAQTRVD